MTTPELTHQQSPLHSSIQSPNASGLDRFERISRMVHRIFHLPITALILHDEEKQLVFDASSSSDAQAEPVASRWAHLTRAPGIVTVADAQSDVRFADDPLVVGPYGLRFLASFPLNTARGERLGTLLLADRHPRTLCAEELACLEDLTATVAAECAMARDATTDALTSLLNRSGFMRTGELALQQCWRQTGKVSLLYFDLNGFKQINDQHGHHEGDRALIQFAQLLVKSTRRSDLVARLGGDEFVILAHGIVPHQIAPLLNRLREATTAYNLHSGKPYAIRYSVGCVIRTVHRNTNLDGLLIEADAKMYAKKTKNRSAAG